MDTTTHSGSTVHLLASIELLRGCPNRQLRQLARHTDVLTVPAGTVLARAGVTVSTFLGIVDGEVEVTDGPTPSRLGTGAALGALGLIRDEPHGASATATTATTLVVVFGPAFRALAAEAPSIGRAVAPTRGGPSWRAELAQRWRARQRAAAWRSVQTDSWAAMASHPASPRS